MARFSNNRKLSSFFFRNNNDRQWHISLYFVYYTNIKQLLHYIYKKYPIEITDPIEHKRFIMNAICFLFLKLHKLIISWHLLIGYRLRLFVFVSFFFPLLNSIKLKYNIKLIRIWWCSSKVFQIKKKLKIKCGTGAVWRWWPFMLM